MIKMVARGTIKEKIYNSQKQMYLKNKQISKLFNPLDINGRERLRCFCWEPRGGAQTCLRKVSGATCQIAFVF